MKFSAVLTKKQAEEMLVYLGDLFTEVRLLDIGAVLAISAFMFSIQAPSVGKGHGWAGFLA